MAFLITRRRLIGGALASAGSAATARANGLQLTPRQTLGPFYPTTLPLDRDNDLVRVTGSVREAGGVVTHIAGSVLDAAGRPVAGAAIEIWQCDVNGRYLHPGSHGSRPRDPGFQGYGRTVTDPDGAYRFRTIRPIPYPGRTPHIHFSIAGNGFERLVTQMYVEGEAGNDRDSPLQSVRDPWARRQLIVALRPAPEVEPAALAGRFDIVVERQSL